MPSALKFIGGGLLSGLGKGLAETGKAKREAALKKFDEDRAEKRALELEGVRQEGRRGLLADTNKAASERLGQNIASRENVAREATTSRERLATEATTSREGIASEANLSRERVATIAANKRTKATDTTAAEDRIIERHPALDEFGQKTDAIDHEGAAVELEERGYKKSAQAQRRKAKGIVEADDLKRATSQADAELEEKTGFFFDDLDEDGGSPTRFHARRVRELLKEFAEARSGKVTPGSGDGIDNTSPAAVGDNPYTGAAPPPDAPDAKQASDGFWYLPPLQSGGKFRRVQKMEADRMSGSRSPRDR